MTEREARDEGRRVGEWETTLALAEALGLPPETRIGPALAEVRRLRAERDAALAHAGTLLAVVERVADRLTAEDGADVAAQIAEVARFLRRAP